MTGKVKEKKKALVYNLFTTPDCIIPEDKRLFYPNWTNSPPKQETVITLNEKRLLLSGGSLAICSKPAFGKSGICEGILANILSPNCDSLGFKVSLANNRNKALYIDTERSQSESWESWERTYKRAGINAPTIDQRIIFGNFKAISIADRKAQVEAIMKLNHDIGLIVFDGAGDFLMDTNSISESCQFIDWINTFNPAISVIYTLHTNPRDDKPRGHIGSELCRRANAVILLRKLDEGIREITSNFEFGKVRHDGDANSYYKFCTDKGMFVSADYAPKSAIDIEKNSQYKEMAEAIFNGRPMLSFSTIVNGIMDTTAKTPDTCKKIFYRNFQDKLVVKDGSGWKVQI